MSRPVGQAGQPQAAGAVRVETAAVVADHQAERAVLPLQRDLDLAGRGVLDHVGQRLGQHVPGGRLDRLGEPDPPQARVSADRHRHRQPAGLGLDGLEQAAVGQHRAGGSRRRSPGRPARSWPGRAASRRGLGRGRRVAPQQLLAHQPGLRRQRHDLLLDAVVQDRLDPAPLGVLARHDPVLGTAQLGGQVQVVHADRGLGGEVGQQPAVLGQQRAVGARAALDPPEDGAPVLDGNVAAGSPDGPSPSVDRPRRRLPAGFQRHPGPGQVEAAADLAGQVAQQFRPSRAPGSGSRRSD